MTGDIDDTFLDDAVQHGADFLHQILEVICTAPVQRRFAATDDDHRPGLQASDTSNDIEREAPRQWFARRIVVAGGDSSSYTMRSLGAWALEIAATFGIAPDCFLYVGDTNTDMETALNAGMMPVGATWGFRPRQELIDSGAKILLNHPLDLMQYL